MAKKHKRVSNTAPPIPALLQSDKNFVKDAQGNITADSILNFVAKLGLQSDNITAYSQYAVGPLISRDRLQLEAMYRSSWLVGQVVDCIAEDMTKDGVTFFSEMKPDDIQKMQVAISEFGIWHELANTIRWARLYGGAVAVMLIDGAKYDTPLRIETIGKNKFKGLLVLDRWMLQPSIGELITDISKDMGKPMYYEVLSGVTSMPAQKIHHSRVLRFDGIELPYYQKLFENLWGLSVVERMYDRLLAFDSATTGASQLLYKAYLRVVGVEGLREALALGGKAENAVIKQFNYIRLMQANEGITLLDAKDQFNTHQYQFSGVSDLLYQFGQQISGATGIPLVRLFGQSPAGLNSSGESDLRNYYDNVHRQQENDLRPQLDKLFAVISKSELEEDLPEDFEFKFVPLWQLSEKEKSEIASQDATTVGGTVSNGLLSKHAALKELRQNSRVTGRFTNITDEEIEDAKNEMPPNAELGGGEEFGGLGGVPSDEPDKPEDPNERLGSANPNIAEESPEKESIEENVTDAGKSYMGMIKRKFLEYKNKFMKDEVEFKEEKHPRKNDGKFAPKGAGESGSSEKEKKQPIYKIEAKTPQQEKFVKDLMVQTKIKQEDLQNITDVMKQYDEAKVNINSWDNKKLYVENKYTVTVNGKQLKAEFSYDVDPEENECHISMMTLPKAAQGKQTGKEFLLQTEETMRKKGIKKMSLLADLSVGGYAWARMGFDFKDKKYLQEAKSEIENLLKKKGIKMTPEIQKKINNLKSAPEISEFTVPGAFFNYKEWGMDLHKDIPKDMKMHVGKAVLLGTVNYYDAIKRI